MNELTNETKALRCDESTTLMYLISLNAKLFMNTKEKTMRYEKHKYARSLAGSFTALGIQGFFVRYCGHIIKIENIHFNLGSEIFTAKRICELLIRINSW